MEVKENSRNQQASTDKKSSSKVGSIVIEK